MSTQKIQVSEYTCGRCGYRWINRNNGKDELIPKRCAKCKSGISSNCHNFGSYFNRVITNLD